MKTFLMQIEYLKKRYPATWAYWPKRSKRAELRYWYESKRPNSHFFFVPSRLTFEQWSAFVQST